MYQLICCCVHVKRGQIDVVIIVVVVALTKLDLQSDVVCRFICVYMDVLY